MAHSASAPRSVLAWDGALSQAGTLSRRELEQLNLEAARAALPEV
ncbi:hypothetical protein [Pyxidicoccus fallax]|nr:hypothetical protein [Pyxidicoccus fallax]